MNVVVLPSSYAIGSDVLGGIMNTQTPRTSAKIDPRGRKVKILATVGPASRSPDMLRRLFRAGADAFRVLSGEHHQDLCYKAIKKPQKPTIISIRPVTVNGMLWPPM